MVPAWVGQIIAMILNTFFVAWAVNLVKKYWPGLSEQYPFLKPIIPPVLGAILTFASKWLTSFLGFTVDLTPILGALTGLIAIMGYDFVNQVKKLAVAKALKRK